MFIGISSRFASSTAAPSDQRGKYALFAAAVTSSAGVAHPYSCLRCRHKPHAVQGCVSTPPRAWDRAPAPVRCPSSASPALAAFASLSFSPRRCAPVESSKPPARLDLQAPAPTTAACVPKRLAQAPHVKMATSLMLGLPICRAPLPAISASLPVSTAVAALPPPAVARAGSRSRFTFSLFSNPGRPSPTNVPPPGTPAASRRRVPGPDKPVPLCSD